MEFIQTTDGQRGISDLSRRLSDELGNGQHVLWLVSGGSNIAGAVQIMQTLPDELTKQLAIFMIDERYGAVGHADSNVTQLQTAGFQPKQATFLPILVPGLSLSETAERYAQAVELAVAHANIIIAQVGIGSDGHVAGILPDSAAVTATGWVTSYETPQYARVTLTFEALRRIDTAYVFAFGPEKAEPLTRLRDENVPLDTQPAQILKQLPRVYIYNDQIGEKS